jgi:hypothetical protein
MTSGAFRGCYETILIPGNKWEGVHGEDWLSSFMGYIRGEGRNQGTLFPVVLDDLALVNILGGYKLLMQLRPA